MKFMIFSVLSRSCRIFVVTSCQLALHPCPNISIVSIVASTTTDFVGPAEERMGEAGSKGVK